MDPLRQRAILPEDREHGSQMPSAEPKPNVLVVGVGNVLRGDDGFGVEVARRLAARTDLPASVRIMETGIGGMSILHELITGYEALLVVDAVDRGGEPGTVYLLEPDIPEMADLTPQARQDALADTHLATPARVFLLARALGVLPPTVYMLGCQPEEYRDAAIGLSQPVERAVEASVQRLVQELWRLAGGHSETAGDQVAS